MRSIEMVVRTFEVEEMVRLPRLAATDVIALGTALVTWAEAAGALPAAIARALVRVRGGLNTLRAGAETRAQENGQSDSKEEWNRALDMAWAALRWWCKGWSLLPYAENAPQSEVGRKLEALLFPDGLRFTQLPFRTQWVESQTRLGLIEREALAPRITELGGQTILEAVRRAHDDFGRALGLTEASQVSETSAIVREGMDEVVASLRRYILQVTAHADPDDPGSMTLADQLLLPLKTWKTRAPAPATNDETPGAEPEPVPPADAPASPLAR
jgi:hypothetical protein